MPVEKVWYSAGSSPGRRTVFAVSPCVRELREEAALPSSVRGPVECCALLMFAMFLASDIDDFSKANGKAKTFSAGWK